ALVELLGLVVGAAVAFARSSDEAASERDESASLDRADRADEHAGLFRLLVHAPVLVCVQRGPAHVVEFVNDAARRLLGPRDVVGKPAREAFPEIAGEYLAALDRVYGAGEAWLGNEIALKLDWDRRGRPYERVFDVVVEPARGASGAVE